MFWGSKIYADCNKYFSVRMNTSVEENLCGKENVSFIFENEKQVDMFASL
jgi:hypothetical protein